MQRIRDMKNLGIKSEEMLSHIGITTPVQLQKMDPFEVYASLKRTVPGISLVALCALIGAIDSQHWLEVKRDRRTEILLRLDDMGIAPK